MIEVMEPRILLAGVADLAANNLEIPYAIGAAGGTVFVNVTVDNSGDAASGKFDVAFRLVIGFGDGFSLATVKRNSIAAGGSQSWTQSLTLPQAATEGDFAITIEVDPADRIIESDDSNNLAVASLTVVSGPPRPDLVASDLLIPDSGAANTTISVDAVVTNLGTAASAKFDVKFYLSTDNDITASDTLLKTVTRDKIAAGATQSWTQSLSLSKTVTEGDYFIGMIVDPARRITESDETNNIIATGPIPISGPPRPDLAASDLTTPEVGAAGGSVSVNATVDNLGLAASGKFDVKFYLSTDDDISTSDDLLLKTVTRNSIAPEGTQNWAQSLTLPKTVADGDYFIGMILDPASRINETDETNNIRAAGTILISGPPRPDLVATDLIVPSLGTIGKAVAVIATVDNAGTAASGKFDVKFYLSTDDEITASDKLLQTVTRNTIAAGGSQNWTQSLNLAKTVIEGDYFIGMIVDPAQKITESNETNNISAAGSILIEPVPPPVSIPTDDRLGNDQFDFAVGFPVVVSQTFQFSIRGHVGPGTEFGDDDGLDRFAFTFERRSTIRIELTNLSVNAVLFLNSLTPGVTSKGSDKSSLNSEVVTQTFPAGGRADLLIGASILGAPLPFGATTYKLTVTIT